MTDSFVGCYYNVIVIFTPSRKTASKLPVCLHGLVTQYMCTIAHSTRAIRILYFKGLEALKLQLRYEAGSRLILATIWISLTSAEISTHGHFHLSPQSKTLANKHDISTLLSAIQSVAPCTPVPNNQLPRLIRCSSSQP